MFLYLTRQSHFLSFKPKLTVVNGFGRGGRDDFHLPTLITFDPSSVFGLSVSPTYPYLVEDEKDGGNHFPRYYSCPSAYEQRSIFGFLHFS